MSLWGNSDADEAKPKWLTAAEKKLTFADARGWVFKKSDNHQEEEEPESDVQEHDQDEEK